MRFYINFETVKIKVVSGLCPKRVSFHSFLFPSFLVVSYIVPLPILFSSLIFIFKFLVSTYINSVGEESLSWSKKKYFAVFLTIGVLLSLSSKIKKKGGKKKFFF